jgi:hypothetical protein
MSMKRCASGHFYDETKHSLCPFCGVPDLNIAKTQPKQQAGQPGVVVLDPIQKTRPRNEAGAGVNGDLGKTKGVYQARLGVNPVVGWLVSVEGPERGRDYRIRSERNFIGRSEKMDICISGDDTVSRERHAVITYYPHKNVFKIAAGDSTGIVYLNGDGLETAKELKPFDRIEIGKTQLVFVPFCGESFQWPQ